MWFFFDRGGLVFIRNILVVLLIKFFDFFLIDLLIDGLCNNYFWGVLFVYFLSCGNEVDKVVVGGKLVYYVINILWYFWLFVCCVGKYGVVYVKFVLFLLGDCDKFLKIFKFMKINIFL